MEAVPVSVKLSAPGGVRIVWSDGHDAIYPYAYLRRKCPCATCEDREPVIPEESPDALPVLGQEPIRPVGADPVGHYAIQFKWSDGHSSGFYAFGYLREICPCPACRPAPLS